MKQDPFLKRYLSLLQYELALQEAEDDLLRFAEVTMPVERRIDDPAQTKYQAARHHRFMADLMMKVERGEARKVIINTGPRYGKSEICTRRFSAWYAGRHPDRDIIIASYNAKFAEDFGKDFQEIVASQRFRQVFPEYRLKVAAVDHCASTQGGNLYFLGRGSTTTGRGGDLIIVDDPTKNEQEAASADFREKCWQWFTQTLLTRRHTDKAALVISQTRWNEDDIVGRLTDPANPAYTDELNAGFEVINLPVEAVEDDPLGREVGEPLWPERFNKAYLAEMRAANPNAFSALYQCDPVPDSGVFYQKDSIFEYDPTDLPDRLTMYAASDHAVSTKNINDRTCLIPWGVDERGDAWVLPDIVWGRIASDDAVERMIDMIKKHKPVFWYAEKGQIAKSIGPFLQKRMDEEQVYVPMVLEMRTQDKVQYAHSARARCAQGRIRFPRFAPWWAEAKKEMLKFPNARFDDFVDTVSIIGMKVNQHTGPGAALLRKQEEYGTFGWLKKQFADQDRRNAADKARAGW